MNIITTDNAELCRKLSGNKNLISAEIYKSEPKGHKFSAGETKTLIGLEDFPEFNGSTVEITSIREDGTHGRAYYVKGDINKFINWVYEYRLK